MKLPPIDPRPDEIVMTRSPDSVAALFRLPTGNSYRVTVEEASSYLQLLGIEQSDRIVDWLWSHYAIHLDVETKVWEVVPYHTVREVFENETEATELMPQVG